MLPSFLLDYFANHIVLEGVAYLHTKNVIHRDLKLENILLHNMRVKVADLGLAVVLDSQEGTCTCVMRIFLTFFLSLMSSSGLCGSPNYIAPEMLMSKSYSFPVDIWACGVMLYVKKAIFEHLSNAGSYAMLYGTMPFAGGSISLQEKFNVRLTALHTAYYMIKSTQA